MADTLSNGSQADFGCDRNESRPSWGNPDFDLECAKWVISLSHCVSVAPPSGACGTSHCVYQTLFEVPHAVDYTEECPMGRPTPRRRRAKRPSGRFTHDKRNGRNEIFRYVNRFVTHSVGAFIGILFIGYVLIFRPSVQVTVSQEAVYAFGGVLSGAAFRVLRLRRHRR
ncbi:hypothetical protein GCM10010226_90850 [Streptomyces phaeofaciens]|uniref:Uncharacterized protein n=1 Tax=Streptomyces phaeofaciens TaxID=68254 RepID=A0A918M1T3_9ACTN|nr:hypothetical protein GCM10010226_90850 [Streptomyces phaeofaciens]